MANALMTGLQGFLWIKEGDAWNLLGWTRSFSAQIQFQTQEARCLGHFDPVSIDPTGRSISITVESFVPPKEGGKQGGNKADYYEAWDDEKYSVFDFVISKNKFLSGEYVVEGIKLTTGLDTDAKNPNLSGTTIASFSEITPVDTNMRFEPNGYVTGGMSFRALKDDLADKA